jgi:hypothetical protein
MSLTKTFFSRPATPDAPIVCTAHLDRDILRIQFDGYRAAFEHLVRSERIPGGFRWTFQAALGQASQLLGLASREAECCGFLSFLLREEGEHIIWETTAAPQADAALDAFFHLPAKLREETRPEYDIQGLKRTFEATGLEFTADQRAADHA